MNFPRLCLSLAVLTSLLGCEEDVAYGTYDVTVGTTNVTGTAATCGADTSSTDSLAGTFFFSIFTESPDGAVSVLGRLAEETGIPADGDYTAGAELSLSASVDSASVEPFNGTVSISSFEEGLSIDFGSVSNLSGSMNCLP